MKTEKTEEQKIIESYFNREATPITKREFKIEGKGYYQVYRADYIDQHPDFGDLAHNAIKAGEYYLIQYR
jgi:hypothetical protein